MLTLGPFPSSRVSSHLPCCRITPRANSFLFLLADIPGSGVLLCFSPATKICCLLCPRYLLEDVFFPEHPWQDCAWSSRLAPVTCHCHLSSQLLLMGTQSWCGDMSCCKISFFTQIYGQKAGPDAQHGCALLFLVPCTVWTLSHLPARHFWGSRVSSLEGLWAHRGAHPGAALRHLAQGKKQFSHQKSTWNQE